MGKKGSADRLKSLIDKPKIGKLWYSPTMAGMRREKGLPKLVGQTTMGEVAEYTEWLEEGEEPMLEDARFVGYGYFLRWE